MATSKAASTKKATAKKPAAAKAKTTVRTISAKEADHKPVAIATPAARTRAKATLPANIVNIVFAELVGTFILTMVALLTFKETGALYAGLAYALLVMAIGAISGAHVNPAVTFGLWTMRRLKSILVPFYIGAQFLGAMFAVIVMNLVTGGLFSGGAYSLNFDHIWMFDWSIFGIELFATMVFLFAYAAATSRRELSLGSRAIGVGLSLLIGLLVGSSMLATLQGSFDTSKWTSVKDVPHGYRIKNATANPAVALAATEASDASLTGQRGDKSEKQYSRFTLETVLGTLIGAALGGNLYLLIAGARRND